MTTPTNLVIESRLDRNAATKERVFLVKSYSLDKPITVGMATIKTAVFEANFNKRGLVGYLLLLIGNPVLTGLLWVIGYRSLFPTVFLVCSAIGILWIKKYPGFFRKGNLLMESNSTLLSPDSPEQAEESFVNEGGKGMTTLQQSNGTWVTAGGDVVLDGHSGMFESGSVIQGPAVVDRIYSDLWNKGNLNVVGDLYSSGARIDTPNGTLIGRLWSWGLKDYVSAHQDAFPNLHFEILSRFNAQDTVVIQWRASGTHTGYLFDIPPSGKDVTITGTSQFHIVDNKVVHESNVFGGIDLLQQLGIQGEQTEKYWRGVEEFYLVNVEDALHNTSHGEIDIAADDIGDSLQEQREEARRYRETFRHAATRHNE